MALAALFRASQASPPAIEASPMTATTLRSAPVSDEATLIPRAADMLFEAWPAVNVSYSLSCGFGKPLSPSRQRRVSKASRRPVSSLWP